MKSIRTFIALLFLSPFGAIAEEFPDDLSKVVWHTLNLSAWPVTSKLNTRVSGGTITLDYDKKNRWPGKKVGKCSSCNANPWIFIKSGSTWHATTFEYFRTGQTSKNWSFVLDGGRDGHMKWAPSQNWRPKNGEIYGFMVAGLSRWSAGNVKERTQVQLYEWGVGPYVAPPPPPPPTINHIIHTLLD